MYVPEIVRLVYDTSTLYIAFDRFRYLTIMSRKASSASSASSIQTWCSDALHDLLGFTDAALASYLVHVGKTAKSVDAIVTVLQEAATSDGSSSDSTDFARKRQAFAEELFQRSHGGSVGVVGGSKSGSHAASKSQRAASSSKTQADWMKDAKSMSSGGC
jgi:hypothetical protein